MYFEKLQGIQISLLSIFRSEITPPPLPVLCLCGEIPNRQYEAAPASECHNKE